VIADLLRDYSLLIFVRKGLIKPIL